MSPRHLRGGMLRAGRVDKADPENADRPKARHEDKGNEFPNLTVTTNRIAPATRRMPLSDKSNLGKKAADATDYRSPKQDEQSHTMNSTQLCSGGGSDTAWWTVSAKERIRELKDALRETLEENRQVHAMLKELQRENERLQERSRQLDLVSMLYEVAKKELAEHQPCERDQAALRLASTNNNDDSKEINRV